MSYIQQSGDTLHGSDGGDQYTGLDRFGRIADQWSFKTASGTPSATLDRFQRSMSRLEHGFAAQPTQSLP